MLVEQYFGTVQQEVEAIYQMENEYFAIGKLGMYVTLHLEQSVTTCLQTELAICILEQALHPVKHITWCVYALFIDDEERIKQDCKYSVTKVSGNQAISLLGGGLSLGSEFTKTGTITG